MDTLHSEGEIINRVIRDARMIFEWATGKTDGDGGANGLGRTFRVISKSLFEVGGNRKRCRRPENGNGSRSLPRRLSFSNAIRKRHAGVPVAVLA